MLDPVLELLLQSWPYDPWLQAALLLTAAVYLRGWRRLRARGSTRFGAPQLTAFLG
ncbi:MAG: hypothetical protein JNM56_31395, partial [Planctomycetia bacterium]|nr:hypothetical protein [Planctomycetia bacterium]